MNPSRYANIVRVGAAYDILATLPFAIPLVAGWCLRAFADLDAWLGLGTAFATLDATSLFFINLGPWRMWRGALPAGASRRPAMAS